MGAVWGLLVLRVGIIAVRIPHPSFRAGSGGSSASVGAHTAGEQQRTTRSGDVRLVTRQGPHHGAVGQLFVAQGPKLLAEACGAGT